MANTSNTGGGIGFFGALTLILMVLKILHKIDISWGLVFAPVIASAIIGAIAIAIVGAFVKSLNAKGGVK